MKAVAIARVSDKHQDSNEAQKARMDAYIQGREGLVLWKYYPIKESSTKGERKQFQAALKEIVAEADKTKETIAVVFETVDRLQRSFTETVELDKHVKDGKIELHFLRENLVIHKNSNSADYTRWDIAVLLARSYVLQLSDNLKRQFEQMRRNGKWTGRPRIGYRNIQEYNDKGEIVRKDIVADSNAHLVSKAFELFATGQYSVTTLHTEMTEKYKMKGRDGRPLLRSDLHRILRDPFYYGMAKSKKYGPYPHNYSRLTDKEPWEKCQQILDGRKKKQNKVQAQPHALQGLLICAYCGCLYSPEVKKGKYVYYSCTNAKRVCKRIYVREDELLKPIYAIFKQFEHIPLEVQERLVEELRMINEGEKVFHDREVARIRFEHDRVQNRIRKLLDIHLDGSITKDEYDKKLQELKDNQYRLGIEMQEHTKGDHEYHINVGIVLNLCRKMGELFRRSEPYEKRAILTFLLQNSIVRGKKPQYTLRKPFPVVLSLASNPTLRREWDSNPQGPFRGPQISNLFV